MKIFHRTTQKQLNIIIFFNTYIIENLFKTKNNYWITGGGGGSSADHVVGSHPCVDGDCINGKCVCKDPSYKDLYCNCK